MLPDEFHELNVYRCVPSGNSVVGTHRAPYDVTQAISERQHQEQAFFLDEYVVDVVGQLREHGYIVVQPWRFEGINNLAWPGVDYFQEFHSHDRVAYDFLYRIHTIEQQ